MNYVGSVLRQVAGGGPLEFFRCHQFARFQEIVALNSKKSFVAFIRLNPWNLGQQSAFICTLVRGKVFRFQFAQRSPIVLVDRVCGESVDNVI
jgi:hypothetical protein